jgi:polyisoprenoid-binding protein YceI
MSMKSRGWSRWLSIGLIGAAALVVGGPFVYKTWISGDAPAPLALPSDGASPSPSTSTTPPASADSLDGTWTIADGTQVGYRVQEVLFGQNNEAVGRTSSVTGTFALNGTTVSAASFSADMATVTSDQSRRDRQFNGRIMDVGTYPKATFELTGPVQIGAVPADGVTGTATAQGKLTLRGTTKNVTVKLAGRRNGDKIQVSGSIPVTFAEWKIPNPSFGPVTTKDRGLLEFLLVFKKA